MDSADGRNEISVSRLPRVRGSLSGDLRALRGRRGRRGLRG